MSDFTDRYKNRIIKQYWYRTRAVAEIELKSGTFEKTYDALGSLPDEFDLDNAYGERLDIIGRIVGIDRIVPFVLDKIAFGFSENPNARGFADKWLIDESAPFQDRFSPEYTSQQLDDNDYKFFIRAKIASNNASAYMVSDDRTSIQDVVNTVFDGRGYVVDNQDMTLSLYVDFSIDEERLRIVNSLNLLPKPQAVRYAEIIQYSEGTTFGFSDNPNAQGFADKFDSSDIGGVFANRVEM